MNRRFQLSKADFAVGICIATIAILMAAGLALPAESGRSLLAKLSIGGVVVAITAFAGATFGAVVFIARLYRIWTNRPVQFSLRLFLVLATAAPVALWVTSWEGEDVHQWLAMSVLVAIVFLLGFMNRHRSM